MINQNILNKIPETNGNIAIYWDMDGTLAEFDCITDYPKDFYINKRPINSILSAAKYLDKKENVTSFVISKLPPESEYITFQESEFQKNAWLDKFTPFIKKENRIFTQDDTTSENGHYLGKYNFFKNLLENNKKYDYVLFVDDDIRHILKCKELEIDFKNFMVFNTLEFID